MEGRVLEATLLDLIAPDNEAIARATAEIEHAKKQAPTYLVPELMEVCFNSDEPAARNLAAVVIRQQVAGAKWVRLPTAVQDQLKMSVVDRLPEEPDALVQHALCEIISPIAKVDLPAQQWPGLLEFIVELHSSPNDDHRDVGAYLLNAVVGAAAKTLTREFRELFNLFSNGLDDSLLSVALRTSRTLAVLAASDQLQRSHIPPFRALIPRLLLVVRRCAEENPDELGSVLDVFEEAVEADVELLGDELVSVVEVALEYGTLVDGPPPPRAACFALLDVICQNRAKRVVKLKLLPNIIGACAAVFSERMVDSEDDDDPFDPEEVTLLHQCVAAVIHAVATQVPPEVVMAILTPVVTRAAGDGSSPAARCAAFSMMQCALDGCAQYVQASGSLESLLEMTYTGTEDEVPGVRRRAFAVLIKLAQDCRPGIAEFYPVLLPRAFDALADDFDEISEEACMALEEMINDPQFGEDGGIEDAIAPSMERLMAMRDRTVALHGAALSCIAGLAVQIEDAFLPYFPQTVEHLLEILQVADEDTEHPYCDFDLAVRAVDVLGQLATAMSSPTHFAPYAEAALAVAMVKLSIDDPDMRAATFLLFGSIAQVVANEFEPFFADTMEALVATICSVDEVEAPSVGVGWDSFDAEDDAAEGAVRYVSNAYMRERKDALEAIAALYTYVRIPARVEWLEPTVTAVRAIRARPVHPALVRASIACETNVCAAMHSAVQGGELPSGSSSDVIAELLVEMTENILFVGDDYRKNVTAEALACFTIHIQEVGAKAFGDHERCVRAAELLLSVLEGRARCNELDGADDDDSDNEGEEYDDEEEGHAVVECAIDAVAPLATALGSDFTEFAPTFFPVLVGFAQPESPVDLRVAILTALGVIAQGMGEAVGPFAADILDVFIASLGDDEEEACQNSAFGIGALFAAAGEAGAPLVPAALSALYDNCIARETASGGVVDNACAAVARMIMALPEVVPLDSVLPTLMGGLPLKEDFVEYVTLFDCLTNLIHAEYGQMQAHLPHFLNVVAHALSNAETMLTLETSKTLGRCLAWLNSNHADDVSAAVGEMDEEMASFLAQAVESARD